MLIEQQNVLQINTVILAEGTFADLHAELWAKVTMARAAMNTTSSPDVLMENCRFLSFHIQMNASMLHEMVGELFSLHQGRRVARRVLEQDSPSTAQDVSLQTPHSFLNMQLVIPEVGQKRKGICTEASASATPMEGAATEQLWTLGSAPPLWITYKSSMYGRMKHGTTNTICCRHPHSRFSITLRVVTVGGCNLSNNTVQALHFIFLITVTWLIVLFKFVVSIFFSCV
jgi:hypothetical protein